MNRRGKHGFTLVELSCAAALGAVILLLAAAAFSRASETCARTSESIRSEREARVAAQCLADDFSAAMSCVPPWFQNASAGQGRAGFFLLLAEEAQRKDARIGDLGAVNYRLADVKEGDRVVRCLLRGVRESPEAFAAMADRRPERCYEPQAADEPLARGVVAFEANPVQRDGDGWKAWNREGVPDAVEVLLVLARRESAARWTTPDDWDAAVASLAGDDDLRVETHRFRCRYGNFHEDD